MYAKKGVNHGQFGTQLNASNIGTKVCFGNRERSKKLKRTS